LKSSPQTRTLFGYYSVYRVVIAILLLGMTFSQQSVLRDFRAPDLFQTVTLGYLILNLVLLVFFRFALATTPKQIFSSVTLDIVIMHVLFYCGTGITGGISNLLIITVAAGNIMIRGRIGFSFAAIASLASLALEIERVWIGFSSVSDVARAGLTGAIYFAAAYIVQNLSTRISLTETLAEERERDIIELERLNHQIIQSMRTGIIVCSQEGEIELCNQACLDLIGLDQNGLLPDQIKQRIELWRNNPGSRTTPFQISQEKPLVQANFSQLQKDDGAVILVFIEDTRLMTQQAQQLKLASLGRLTASIAHEVRNPLGAISHATQLLAESESLSDSDKRMTDIIQRHSKRVNLIIENTLQLSRRAEPETRDLDLKPWLEKVINEYREQHNTHPDIKVIIEQESAHARFDPDQIEQVLVNLMDNGLRHGHQVTPNSTLTVRLCETHSGEQAYIDVIDQGLGVSEENRPHLFEPFFTTESQGTGLGLYLSREICEANQAQLDYIDSYTQGACFRVMFAHHNRIV